jgi:hypothetical protein
MNPPFGEATTKTQSSIADNYKFAFIDVLAAFVERSLNLCSNGKIGALTSRACLYTKTLSEWRKKDFLPTIEYLVDLGGNVLDGAMVFACASVFNSPQSLEKNSYAFDLKKIANREDELQKIITKIKASCVSNSIYINNREEFYKINNFRFLYNIPKAFLNLANSSETLVKAGGSARAGSTTYDDFRFLRLVWEIPNEQIGWSKTWVFFSKGGYFETFYNDLHLLINWQNDGYEVGEFNRIGYDSDAQSRRASTYYKIPALTYSRRTVKGFAPRALPSDCIFADKGPAIFPPKNTDLGFFLGYWNASPIRALVHLQVQAGSFETGVINNIPWLENSSAGESISKLAREIWQQKASIYRNWEIDRLFVLPPFNEYYSIANFSEHLLCESGVEMKISKLTKKL